MEEEVEDIPVNPQPAVAAAAAAAESGAIIIESKTSPDSSALKDMNNPLFLNHGQQRVSLLDDGMNVEVPNQGKVFVKYNDIVGAEIQAKELIVHAYPSQGGPTLENILVPPADDGKQEGHTITRESNAKRRHLAVTCALDTAVDGWEGDAEEWIEEVRHRAGVAGPRGGRVMVIVNPNSGAGKAERIYVEHCEQVFRHAGLVPELLRTKRQFHCQELAQTANAFDDYYCVVLVGGDGIVFEFVQGIMASPDKEALLQKPFGVIPGGSGNGLAKSILFASGEDYDATNSAFLVAKGRSQPLDLGKLHTRANPVPVYAFLSLEWGLLADIDIESDSMRKCCGSNRFLIQAFIRLFCCTLRRYSGRISFLPAPASGSADSAAAAHADEAMPAIDEPVPASWTTIASDHMISLWASNVSHCSYDLHSHPQQLMADGAWQLQLMEGDNIGSCLALRHLLGLETGAHVGMPGVECYRIRAMRLEPIGTPSHGHIAVDGEVMPYATIQVEVMPSVLRVFCDTPGKIVGGPGADAPDPPSATSPLLDP